MSNERAEEQISQSNDNECETHQIDPTSREATIATTEEPQKSNEGSCYEKSTQFVFFCKKKSRRHGITGKECKFLHPAPC